MPLEIPRMGSLWRVRPQAAMAPEFDTNRHLPNQFFRIGYIEGGGAVATHGTEVVGVSHASTWRGTIRKLHELFVPVEDKEVAA